MHGYIFPPSYIGFLVLDFFPALTFLLWNRKDTEDYEDRLGFCLCFLVCVLVFGALVTSPRTPISQEPTFPARKVTVRDVRGRGHLLLTPLPISRSQEGSAASGLGIRHDTERSKLLSQISKQKARMARQLQA